MGAQCVQWVPICPMWCPPDGSNVTTPYRGIDRGGRGRTAPFLCQNLKTYWAPNWAPNDKLCPQIAPHSCKLPQIVPQIQKSSLPSKKLAMPLNPWTLDTLGTHRAFPPSVTSLITKILAKMCPGANQLFYVRFMYALAAKLLICNNILQFFCWFCWF